MKYPELPLYPSDVLDIVSPMDRITLRPTVWDEDGIPLNSDTPFEALRPNRVPEDYPEDLADLAASPQEDSKVWANSALMKHVFRALPDMLMMAADVSQETREVLGMDDDDSFTLSEGLGIQEGLQKAWALLMYGDKRLPNGALPRHFASMQRILPGYEGLLIQQMYKTPLDAILGNAQNGDLDTEKLKQVMFDPNTDVFLNPQNNERCPANRMAQVSMLDCMFLPRPEIEAKYGEEWLSKADPQRRVSKLGIRHGAIVMLGVEASTLIFDMGNPETVKNLLMSHRFLVGDKSPEVQEFVMRNASL